MKKSMIMKILTVCACAAVSVLTLASCTFSSTARVAYVDDLYDTDGKSTAALSAREPRESRRQTQVYVDNLDFDNYYPGMIEQSLTGTVDSAYLPAEERVTVNNYIISGDYNEGFSNGYAQGYSDGWGWRPSWYGWGGYTAWYRPGWSLSLGWGYPWYGYWNDPWWGPAWSWYNPWYSPWYNPWYGPGYTPWYDPWWGWGGGHHHWVGGGYDRGVIYGSGRRDNVLSGGQGLAGGSYRRPSVSGYNGSYGGSSAGSYNGSGRRPSSSGVVSGGTSGIAGGRGTSIYGGGVRDSYGSGSSIGSGRNNTDYRGNSGGVRTPVSPSRSYDNGSSFGRSGTGSYGGNAGGGSYGGGVSRGGASYGSGTSYGGGRR